MSVESSATKEVGVHPILKKVGFAIIGVRTQPLMNHSNTLEIETPINETRDEGAMPDDDHLMRGIQARDGRALEKLLERHRGLLKSVILHVVNSHATADDVLQECLVAIWNRATTYNAEKGTPVSWMVTMARRRAIDSLRRDVSYANARVRLEDETCHSIPAPNSDCEDADMATVIQQHIDRLPEHQQVVIRLAFLQGMSQREVAQATHTPLGTVKTRIDLGLRKLRSAFLRPGMSVRA